MKNLTKILCSFVFVCLSYQTIAQELSLQDKYTNLVKGSETYAQYKMIPQTSLNSFWSQVKDSLNQANTSIEGLKLKVEAHQDSLAALTSRLVKVQNKLEVSLQLNDSINFLGIDFSKAGYHVMVWAIIISLVVAGMILYFMYIRSNTVTTRYKRELAGLATDFENHKSESRDKQMKLKRELQTAINELSERR